MLEANFYDRTSICNAIRYVKLQNGILSQYVDNQQSQPFSTTSLNFLCSFESKKQIINKNTVYILKIYHQKGEISLATQKKQQFQIWHDQLFLLIPAKYHKKKWKEIKKVGSGNFSDVQRVIDYKDKTYAVKKILKVNSEKDKEKQMRALQNQINIMKACHSSNLATLLGIYASDQSYYLQMPFYEGGTLSSLKKQKALKAQDIKTAMKDILTGLVQLKKCKIIHRDIKPDNILMHIVNGQKRFVIIDFGLATFSDAQYIFYRCGTPGYVSPQIANMNSKQTRIPIASDIFSLGAVFYFLITGKMLFMGSTGDSILYKNRRCSINFNSEQFSKFRTDEKDLIIKLLQRDHKDRITAQQALKHTYFTNNFQQPDEYQQIPDEQNDISKKIIKLNSFNIKDKSTCKQSSVQFQSVISMSSRESNYLTFENFQNNNMLRSSDRKNIQKEYRCSHFLAQSKKKSGFSISNQQ